ncbi:hypothetical protein JTE90_019355 [Oedothorax gibbosus]|uniref:P/Homo B domain-containing protein n=1 Tax=Oedothorax gibbosus TaxID=931172 RepID=A0AAV6UKE2_9ARAC|nr:hypothetical protein JTE90_019355 [Oedothorax gibbosus]
MVKWAEHQKSLQRVHRIKELPHRKHSLRRFKRFRQEYKNTSIVFDDPLFKEQWYLLNTGQTGSPPENDINVFPVWESGITGKGVRISVLDDGIDPGCEEVADNYDSMSSEDFSYIHRKFIPVAENSHGTYCAAIAAGVANNGICGVGVAYDAKIGGVRILDGPVTDVQEAIALVHALDYVDIYTASWGPNDDGKTTAGPGKLAKLAFEKGVTEGRGGRGSIYAWAAGNGGRHLDNCNMDGYASSPYTLTIGALTADGRSAYYSEPCAAVIASTYVGGSHTPLNARNFKRERRKIKVVVPEGRGRCRQTFQGTSAAAPMAAGAIALALQANPRLGWRDVQHILVRTSRVPDSGESGWKVNAAGHHFHLKAGFGVLDAEAMVKAARGWKNVGQLIKWTSQKVTDKKILLPHNSASIPLLVQKSTMKPNHCIDLLESVVATVGIADVPYGDIELFLVSPSGTRSQILTRRPHDNTSHQLAHWDFLTLHFWGEDPEGWWTLVVSNHADRRVGVLESFSLTLRGTKLRYS